MRLYADNVLLSLIKVLIIFKSAGKRKIFKDTAFANII